jgi:hypothetical protein
MIFTPELGAKFEQLSEGFVRLVKDTTFTHRATAKQFCLDHLWKQTREESDREPN